MNIEWDHNQDHGDHELNQENLKLELESRLRGKKCNLEIQEFIRDTTWDHHSWHYHFNEISTCDPLISPQKIAHNKEIRFEKQNKSQIQTQKPQCWVCYSQHDYKSKAVTTTQNLKNPITENNREPYSPPENNCSQNIYMTVKKK